MEFSHKSYDDIQMSPKSSLRTFVWGLSKGSQMHNLATLNLGAKIAGQTLFVMF